MYEVERPEIPDDSRNITEDVLRDISRCKYTACAIEGLPALAGNRTRISRVAGENSTIEPPMLGIPLARTARSI